MIAFQQVIVILNIIAFLYARNTLLLNWITLNNIDFITMVLSNSHYPEEFSKEFETQFILETKTVILSYFLPNTEDIPNISGYKYITTSKQIRPIELAKKNFQSFYENIIFQTALKTINEVFKSIYVPHVFFLYLH